MKAAIAVARHFAHRAREAVVYPQKYLGGENRRVVILQNDGRQMSSLLRGYEIADGLKMLGWHAIVFPKQLEKVQRTRLLRWLEPDVVVLLGSRNPVNSADLLEHYTYVYDLDDADFLDPKLTHRMERDVGQAAGVIAGSRYVARWCRRHNPETRVIWTGSRPTDRVWTDHADRPQTVAWAQSNPVGYSQEFDFVVSVMERLSASGIRPHLRLYGNNGADDGGRIKRLERCGIEVEWLPFMPYQGFLESLDTVAVGLSPICTTNGFSRGKSFGKILAYLDARVPIVTSDEVDHECFFTSKTGVVTNDLAVWTKSIAHFLNDPSLRQNVADAAFQSFVDRLSLETASRLVSDALEAALSKQTTN